MRVKDSDTRSFEEIQAEIATLPTGQLPPMLELPFALWIFALPGATDSAILAGDGTLPTGRYTYSDTIHVGATFDSVEAYQSGMETQGDSPMHLTLGMGGWLTVEVTAEHNEAPICRSTRHKRAIKIGSNEPDNCSQLRGAGHSASGELFEVPPDARGGSISAVAGRSIT